MAQHPKSHKRQVHVGGETTSFSKVIGPKKNEKGPEIYF
jgi:hypothetical protein